ncbi:MAG: bifunctional phosphopantothenoylcysteine decarboxylase/phosphopantothenate--cysteine ligase CoaBC [Bacteroidales bacterium]|nr:bifunctional phosphopantothenoylcysteine decarboxylase/phosphopantothenate--cysteine ligase CoaBC [Bacteroidales bacterium]
MLEGKHILLGITGSIAAYKAAILVRSLVKEGAEVKVIMTDMAKDFITPLTMATLTKNPILVDHFDPQNGSWNSHIALGIWADLYVIAPVTANTIAKMSAGIADNLLLTTYLSARCPVMIAPAMDLDMWEHPATQNNLSTLSKRGVIVVEPSSGELASGLEGKGRMEEPDIIVEQIKKILCPITSFAGKRILVTAGPTREEIDPVRFITNYSSGKMGYAIAEEFATRGAEVILVSGPTSLNTSSNLIKRIDVTSSEEMFQHTMEIYKNGVDIVVLCAAVSDFTPNKRSETKIKREQGKNNKFILELKPTQDIAAELGKIKRPGTLHIGFALETDNEVPNALAKLDKKNLDAIVLNSLRDEGAGFGTDTNKISIIDRKGSIKDFNIKSKQLVAVDIVNYIERLP